MSSPEGVFNTAIYMYYIIAKYNVSASTSTAERSNDLDILAYGYVVVLGCAKCTCFT